MHQIGSVSEILSPALKIISSPLKIKASTLEIRTACLKLGASTMLLFGACVLRTPDQNKEPCGSTGGSSFF